MTRRFGLLLLFLALITIAQRVPLRTPWSPGISTGGATAGADAPPWPPSIAPYLRSETGLVLFRVLYQYGQQRTAPDGALGPNIGSSPRLWYVEYQRAGAVDVIAGVTRRQTSLIDEGLRAFRFGLDRQNPNGAFPGSMWPFHGTAMFLAEAAPALLVLKYSSFDGPYASELRRDTEAFHRAALYLVRHIGGAPRIDDSTKDHRFFEAALALQATSALSGDARLAAWAERYARRGLALERLDGVLPEDGGHDTGYQALGLTYAIRYVLLSPSSPFQRQLVQSLARAARWELAHVRPDGTIDQSGDTRTAACHERDPLGRCKTTFYATIASALARWSVLAHDVRFERAAYLVWRKNWALQPGDILPPAGLYVRPNPARRNDWLTVWGTRFQPLESVRVLVNGHPMQTVQCDQIGSFGGHSPEPNAHFPLTSLSPGTYAVTARGSLGTVRSTHITVLG